MTSKSGKELTPVAMLKLMRTEPGMEATVDREMMIFDGQTLRIGRMQSNDLVLTDAKISRFHAIISASATGVVISDLASKNGTFVNSKRMNAPVDLQNGDVIEMGAHRIAIELTPTSENVPSESTETSLSRMLPFEISVLLVDVCGYTSMTQAVPEEDVAEMLRTWLNFSASVVERYDGVVDKYIGDCVMSLWRKPSAPPKELALGAAQAGIEIVRATAQEKMFSEWKHAKTHPWRCRAVIHSGTALVGSLGGDGRGGHTVLGDTVNIAFRIEQLADRFEETFVVSEFTASLLHEDIPLASLGRFALDGRPGTMEIFGKKVF